MNLKITSNPGRNDFPELKPLPVVGDVCDFDQATSVRLLKMGLAVEVTQAKPSDVPLPKPAEASQPKLVKAVPPPPAVSGSKHA